MKKTSTLCLICLSLALFTGCGNTSPKTLATATANVVESTDTVQDSAASTPNTMQETVENSTAIPTNTADITQTSAPSTAAKTTEDPSLEAVLNEVQSKFVQLIYTDPDTGVSLNYNLFVPTNYDASKTYPMITFIPDDSLTGKSTIEALSQGYGGVIWATDAEQKKHESFVLVPSFASSTIAGGKGQSGSAVDEIQVDTFLDLLKSIQTDYSIDTDRFYITGQSMGCMTSFYLNSHYPDMFTATLYVSGQWDVTQLSPLETQKFFYFAAGGDNQASTGQKDLMNLFNETNTKYVASDNWDATWDTTVKNETAEKMIAENTNRNFVTWETGTVLVNSTQNMEHMASFDYGYTVPAVRDWLFSQKK